MSRQLAAGRLAGRGCVVTGASGIAAAAARRFVEEGADVFVVSRDAKECAELGLPHAVADLAVEDDAVGALDAAADALVRIDALFAVAGGSGRRFGDGPLHEVTLDAWQATMALNATPAFLAARESVRRMLSQRPDTDGQRGSVVLTSSVLAFDPAPNHFATHAYAAAKAAIIGLTKAAAAAYAGEGVRVNALAPGAVDTPMSGRAASDAETAAYLREKQPLTRGMLQAADVAEAAVYLCSRESRSVTGQTLTVDGGWTVRGDRR